MRQRTFKRIEKEEPAVIDAVPVDPKNRPLPKRIEKVDIDALTSSSAEEVAKKLDNEKKVESEVMEKLDKILEADSTIPSSANNEDDDEDMAVSPFAKYDALTKADEEDDDDDRPKPIVPRTVEHPVPLKGARNARPRKKVAMENGDTDNFMIDDDSASIASLTKGNVWATDADEIYEMLLEGRRTEHWAENQVHYMNIIKPVYDVQFVNREESGKVAKLEAVGYKVYPYPAHKDQHDCIALRKREIRKITDLTMENVLHLSAQEILHLIEENMGTGWKGLPLAIQDIILTGFYVDSSELPAAAMHRAGGIIDRRKADGYEVLEIVRGTWIEAIFIKFKPRQEKRRLDFSIDGAKTFDAAEEDSDEEDDSDEDDGIDRTEEDREDDEELEMEEESPEIEDFEEIPDMSDEDE